MNELRPSRDAQRAPSSSIASALPVVLPSLLRIGLVRYELPNVQPPRTTIAQICAICGEDFVIGSICGVLADEQYAFLGNICLHCLGLSVPQIRNTWRRAARVLRNREAETRQLPDESWMGARLLAEAQERERWAECELTYPGTVAFEQARGNSDHWLFYPLLRNSTAIMYRGWFG